MVHVSALLAFAASVSALPLNINLGAYSPALVVGDGEISFGGQQDVTNLMNALEGAAVSGAAANAAGVPEAASPKASAKPAATQAAAQQAAAPVAAQQAAEAAPATQQADQAPQITALQGMGKEIAPRVVPLAKDSTKLASRDLAGFDRALTYAAAALKSGPEIQLGTGKGGSGVGITVGAGGATSGTATNASKKAVARDTEGNEIDERSFENDAEENEVEKRSTGEAFYYDATTGTEKEKAKRSAEDDEIENRNLASNLKTTVTTMYIRGGPSAGVSEAFDGSSVQKRSVQRRASSMRRSAPSAGIDGVNLNVNDGQGVTLTFVETKASDAEE